MNLEDRVKRLERENTLLKGSVGALALFALLAIVFGTGKPENVAAAADAPPNQTVGTLAANAIILISKKDGHKCATLDVSEISESGEMPSLAFYTAAGRKTVALFTHETKAGLLLRTGKKKGDFTLTVDLPQTPAEFPE